MPTMATRPSDQPTTYVNPLSLHFNQQESADNLRDCQHEGERLQYGGA